MFFQYFMNVFILYVNTIFKPEENLTIYFSQIQLPDNRKSWISQ